MLSTEYQKKISFKSYAWVKLWISVAILINLGQNLRFFNISLKLYLVSQFWSKLADIWTRSSLDNYEQNQRAFFKNFDFFWFYAKAKKKYRFVCENPPWWNSFFAHPAEKIINFLFFWKSHKRSLDYCNELFLCKHCTIRTVIGMATIMGVGGVKSYLPFFLHFYTCYRAIFPGFKKYSFVS